MGVQQCLQEQLENTRAQDRRVTNPQSLNQHMQSARELWFISVESEVFRRFRANSKVSRSDL
jgi:hypothetical protein